jgi:RNA polymerase sigma-70 factor (sigma-E family)
VTVTDGFEQYARTRAGSLLRFAFLLCHDQQLAEDLVQEALARTYRSWHRIEQLDHPDLYVRRIVLNQLLSWRRRRGWGREVTTGWLPEHPSPIGAGDAGDREALWALVKALPPRQRAVIVLRFYEDLPDVQIARVLDCSPATVRAHAFKALARLRRGADAELVRGESR